MGTPAFAVGVLARLLQTDVSIVGVITAPDKAAGRGKKIQQSAVKEFALKHNLKVLQPENLKDQNFITELKHLKPNLQIVVAFRMLPKIVWQLPKYGTFNLHASLLPDYRGAAPINWALINGDTKTGVTTFFIDENIDTGTIILKKEVAISPQDNAGSLHDKLKETGSQLVVDTVCQIAKETVKTYIQEKSIKHRPAPKIHKQDCRIDWSKSGLEIHNHIRGLSPYPTAWTVIKNNGNQISTKIFESKFIASSQHQQKIGTLQQEKKQLRVAVKDGFIYLIELQLATKKRMSASALLNGFIISKDAHCVLG